MLFISFSGFIVALLALTVGFFKPSLFKSLFGKKSTKIKSVSLFGLIVFLAFLGVIFNLNNFKTTNARKVSRVIDGDTVELVSGARVRLIGIDAPEIGKPYAREAKNELEGLILGEEVTLERDTSNTDKYDRLLRYIWQANTLVNEKVVREGFAKVVSYPPDIKYQERLGEAEVKAKEENRGLWLDN